jgi:hypothetical protein
VITEDEVMRLLKRADPARVDDRGPTVDATGYLATLRARSSNVTLIDTEPTPTRPDTSHRRLYIGLAAAAAVVAILVGALVYVGRSDSNEPQIPAATTAPRTPETAAEQVAMRYLAASDAWDGDTVRSLVADGAEILHNEDHFTVDRLLAFERLREFRYLQPECTATSAGPPAEVTCTYLVQSAFPGALGMGPFNGSRTDFEIVDGRVQRLQIHFDFDKVNSDGKGNMYTFGFEAFIEWMEEAHPGEEVLDRTPEVDALLEQRVEEWKAVGPALRFMQARNEWDGETVRSMVADDAVIEGDFAVAVADDYVVNADFERTLQWQFVEHCTIVVVGPPAMVTCPYAMQNWLGRALDVGPYDTGSFEFEVADGQIQRVSHEWDFTQYDQEAFGVFVDWLDETHPGDRDVMFDVDADGNDVRRMTPEALALFEQRIPEFVRSVQGS